MKETFQPDTDAYLERIGFPRPAAPELGALHGIVRAHVGAIPFENLDILMGRPISVAPADIERKLVHERRGGYCFEQNTLLQHALSDLGFDVTPISARVLFQKPRFPVASRTHLFLRVRLEEKFWLVDVGVGGLSPTAAVELVLDRPQPTPHETRRIIKRGAWTGLEQRSPDAVLYHQALIEGVWENVSEFTLEEMHPIDLTLANWYTSTHPESHFKDRLTVALSFEGGRKTLLNREFKLRLLDGSVTTRILTSDQELLEVLASEFGIVLASDVKFTCPGLE